MKKTIIYILMAVLFVSMLGLNACGSKEQAADPEETLDAVEDSGDGMQDGGWTVADSSAVELPEEVQSAFDKALETLTGSYNEVKPIAYLGRQVVSGTNYAVLYRVTYADEKAPAGLVVLTVYEDLEGNAELLSSEDFSIADYNTGDEAAEVNKEEEPVAGGWQMPEQITVAEIPEEAKNAFNKAVEGFTGNDLTPMALLGTQVVAGTNYAFLCHSKLATAEPSESIQVVIVYEDLEGNAEITGINTVDVAGYVNN